MNRKHLRFFKKKERDEIKRKGKRKMGERMRGIPGPCSPVGLHYGAFFSSSPISKQEENKCQTDSKKQHV